MIVISVFIALLGFSLVVAVYVVALITDEVLPCSYSLRRKRSAGTHMQGFSEKALALEGFRIHVLHGNVVAGVSEWFEMCLV